MVTGLVQNPDSDKLSRLMEWYGDRDNKSAKASNSWSKRKSFVSAVKN